MAQDNQRAIPPALRAALTPESLLALVEKLAVYGRGRRAGINVAEIVRVLMADHGPFEATLDVPRRAALYQALRDAVRQQAERMDSLDYVTGLS